MRGPGGGFLDVCRNLPIPGQRPGRPDGRDRRRAERAPHHDGRLADNCSSRSRGGAPGSVFEPLSVFSVYTDADDNASAPTSVVAALPTDPASTFERLPAALPRLRSQRGHLEHDDPPACDGDVRRSHRRSARTDHLGTSRQPPGCSSCDPVVEVVTATAQPRSLLPEVVDRHRLKPQGFGCAAFNSALWPLIRCRASSTSSLKAAASPCPYVPPVAAALAELGENRTQARTRRGRRGSRGVLLATFGRGQARMRG